MAKVLMLTSSYPRQPRDTAGVFIYTLFTELVKRYPVEILIPDSADGVQARNGVSIFKYFIPSVQRLAYGSGILNNIKSRPWLILQLPFYILAQIFAVRRLLKKDDNIHIIHAHWWLPQALSAVLCKILFCRAVKVVCTLHGSDVFALNSRLLAWLRQVILKRVSVTIVTSQAARRIVEKNLSDQSILLTIPAGIRPSDFGFRPDPIDRSRVNLLFIGRLVISKGVWDLVKCLVALHLALPDLTLRIIGDGPERKRLEAYIGGIQLGRCVEFHGSVSNDQLLQYYYAADLLVLPSHTEGVPVAIMEAMCCGTLVLGTPVGGVPDLVREGVTGFLCSPHDPASITTAITRIYREYTDDQLDRIRHQAHDEIIAGYYNLHNQTDKLISIYETLY